MALPMFVAHDPPQCSVWVTRSLGHEYQQGGAVKGKREAVISHSLGYSHMFGLSHMTCMSVM